jgi:hypothetical protein
MDAQATITLRDVARRLAQLSRSGADKIADGKLLGLLKAGELKAGIYFHGQSTRWIPISRSYWIGVSSDKFRSIRRSDKNKLPGTYKVRLSQVADEYSKVMSQHMKIDQQRKDEAIWEELKAALAAASRRYEVVIKEEDYKNYLERHNLEEPPPRMKGRRGRPAREGWRQLCVFVGAYIIKHHQTTKEAPKIEEAAKNIHKIAKNEVPEGVVLNAFETGSEARQGIGHWIGYYNHASQHPSVDVIEEKRLC